MPVVGSSLLGPRNRMQSSWRASARALSEQGFVEGHNVVIESRFAATGQYDGLPSLASDLVRLPVTVLVANWNCWRRARRQGRHYDDTDRICERERPGEGRPGHQH